MTRSERIIATRNNAITELFKLEQDTTKLVNDLYERSDTRLSRHALNLAEVLAILKRTRTEMIEENVRAKPRTSLPETDIMGHVIERRPPDQEGQVPVDESISTKGI